MTPTPDISTLSETAITYQKALKRLPFFVLGQTLAIHGFNIMPGVQNKDVITNYFRYGGIAKPYVPEKVEEALVGKTQERILQVQKAYTNVRDEPSRFKKTVIGPDQILGKNKSKQHPWQLVMLWSMITTYGEDIIDAIFPAKYDPDDRSPMGLFDGIDTLIDRDITNGLISPALGNQRNTGALTMPTSDTDTTVYDQLVEFWRTAHPLLKAANTELLVPTEIAEAYDRAYAIKYKTKPTMDIFNRTFLDGTSNRSRIVRSDAMGTGQRIILTVPGNFDFGMDTESDATFVQIRDIDPDPNVVRFWIQADYGCRVRNVHPKVFRINEGTPVPQMLSGDYVAPVTP